ncbi:beta-ketoacyl-ACP synthase 3 [Streptomyces sp. NPDC001404]|uniref:beta-ketoacyl-ACP synthase 3 n=1 Tax=Streptomyces sp. NPDC001404 TaxID=3364571 RepID=UPI003675129D
MTWSGTGTGTGLGSPAAVICGLGTAVPDTVVANEDICAHLAGVTPDWIASRTGITHRVRAGRHVSTADLAVQAGARALASCESTAVDVLVLATVTPDHRLPATAPEVAARLGLPGIPAFDLSAACTGLLYALGVAGTFLVTGTARQVLVVAADRLAHLTDPTDPATAPLFGDAAAALLLRRGTAGEPGALGPVLLGADGRHADALVVPHGGLMRMRGPETFHHAVTRMSEVSQQAVQAAGWSLADLDRFVPHQANARITAAVGRRLHLDEPRVLQHIERVGNTSAASIALTLATASADGRLRPGHRVLMAAFGAGLTWGAATVLWPGLNPPAHQVGSSPRQEKEAAR